MRTNFVKTQAAFDVTADGTGPLAYQWRKDGLLLSNTTNISGCTSPILTLAAVSAGDAGNYDVVISGFGSITSAPALLTVANYSSNQVPVITSAPQSSTNNEGTTVSLSAGVSGSGPFSYQWRRNGTNVNEGTNISGARTWRLVLTNASIADTGSYNVVVSGYASVTSSPPATLTVISSVPGLILYEPFNYAVGGLVTTNSATNWATGGSGINDTYVVTGSLANPGLAPSIANSITNGGAGLGARRFPGTNFSSGALYFSALFRINAMGSWDGTGAQIGQLLASDDNSVRFAILVKSNSPAGYVFGVRKGGTGATTVFDSIEHYAGETVFLCGKYDLTLSLGRDTLWINPSPATFGADSESTSNLITVTTGVDGQTDRFNFRQNSATTIPANVQWDELRIGVSWAVVTAPAIPIPPLLSGPKILPAGGFQFSYSNANNAFFCVYASTNFTDWFSIGSPTQATAGFYQFTDESAPNFPRRFYQLQSR